MQNRGTKPQHPSIRFVLLLASSCQCCQLDAVNAVVPLGQTIHVHLILSATQTYQCSTFLEEIRRLGQTITATSKNGSPRPMH